MGEENVNFDSAKENQIDDFLYVASVKEDWGGDGTGRMNLSGRRTAISPEYVPRQYQFFDTNAVPEKHDWRVNGMPDDVVFGSRRSLTWHDCGASTSKVVLPPHFEIYHKLQQSCHIHLKMHKFIQQECFRVD